MKTRTKRSGTSKSASQHSEAQASTIPSLEPSVSDPPFVFVLPESLSTDARIVTAPNPANAVPSRYLICPDNGCYEFTRIAAPKRTPRSWLLSPDRPRIAADSGAEAQVQEMDSIDDGYVLQTPQMMVATPIDPLFLLLPALGQDASSGGKPFYLSLSDYLERLAESSAHIGEMLKLDKTRRLEQRFEASISDICTSMDDGTETLYLLSNKRLLSVLVAKAERMVRAGLPASMEEKFVRQLLVVPLLQAQREQSSLSLASENGDDSQNTAESDAPSSAPQSQDTQRSDMSNISNGSSATSIPLSQDPLDASKDIVRLLRTRTALNFIMKSYVPGILRKEMNALLCLDSSPIDFTPLDTHLANLDRLKKEAQALRSLSDNISRKRSAIDDDEAMEKAEAKKRKKEEEELKKKNMSRGVKQLQKVDRSGMKTLSSFFSRAPAKKS